MPTLSEFRITIGLRFLESDDQMLTFFRFETVRQFRAFSYEIDIVENRDAALNQVDFRIQGVTAPSQSLASTGPAVTEISYPDLKGNWKVVIEGAKQQTSFIIRVMPKSIRMEEPPDGDQMQVTINESVEVVRD
jgi:hypothetical protein